MRKEIVEFRISDVNFHISNMLSVYFAKSVRIKNFF